MARNVEIKARVERFEDTCAAAQSLSGQPAILIEQVDVFFNVPEGRLKLRTLSPTSGELIFYQRDNVSGPKISTYQVVTTGQPAELTMLLTRAYGEEITIRKRRRLYRAGRTRIHLDEVEGLGNFLELEVVLNGDEDLSSGELEARDLLSRLNVDPDSLIDGAYADLLLESDKISESSA